MSDRGLHWMSISTTSLVGGYLSISTVPVDGTDMVIGGAFLALAFVAILMSFRTIGDENE